MLCSKVALYCVSKSFPRVFQSYNPIPTVGNGIKRLQSSARELKSNTERRFRRGSTSDQSQCHIDTAAATDQGTFPNWLCFRLVFDLFDFPFLSTKMQNYAEWTVIDDEDEGNELQDFSVSSTFSCLHASMTWAVLPFYLPFCSRSAPEFAKRCHFVLYRLLTDHVRTIRAPGVRKHTNLRGSRSIRGGS